MEGNKLRETSELALWGFLPSFAGAQQAPAVAAQDLTSVFKAGYLEKRRKGPYLYCKSGPFIHHIRTVTLTHSSLDLPPQIIAFLAPSGRSDGAL